jgi:hypothetical protein
MARFFKSNKAAASDMAIVNSRRPGTVQGFFAPVSRRDLGNSIFHPTSG